MSQRIYISLGKNGDLVSLLPILHDDAQSGKRSAVMVCKEFAPLFSGVSYCDVIEFEGGMWDLDTAVSQAKHFSDDVKCCQVLGATDVVLRNTYQPAGQQHALTDSFQKEVYQVLGRLDLWRKQPKPVFDKRDHKREQEFIAAMPVNPKGAILVSTGGQSSPFKADELLFELLESRFGQSKFGQVDGLRNIIDLSTIRAEQFYDMLAVFEAAHYLVTTDSAPLHLAWACNIPVVALINDSPSLWHGSAWRTNHICHIRYKDFANRAMDMARAIDGPGSPFNKAIKKPRIFHVWSGYDITPENRSRHEIARMGWAVCYCWEGGRWVGSPHELGATGFDSQHPAMNPSGNWPLAQKKDRERSPFLKQVIRTAAMRAEDDDIICLTRCDTIFHTLPTVYFSEKLLKHTPCYSHRTLRTLVDEDNPHWHESDFTWHPMVDLFAFTKKWWKEHQVECPELLLRNDHWWNRVFLDLIKRHGGKEIPWAIYRAPSTAKAMGDASSGELHNEELHKTWQSSHGQIVLYPSVSKQLPTVIVNRHALSPFSYNPSIIRWNNRLLLSVRWHDANDYSTALAIADIDEHGNVKSNKLISIPQQGGSEEDARLFTMGNDLYMSYVDSNYPSMPCKCVTRYGRLTEDTQWALQDIQQPVYGENHGNAMVKNLVMFEWEKRLLCIWETSPETILVEIKGSSVTEIARFEGPRWPWGKIRGGTTPLPYKGKLLRFFHSGLDNECPPYRRRYYAGAMITEPFPPFKVLDVSKEPILRGSETDDLSEMERASILHYKPRVVFLMSAIPHGDGWLASCGVNDSHCALVTIKEKDLKL